MKLIFGTMMNDAWVRRKIGHFDQTDKLVFKGKRGKAYLLIIERIVHLIADEENQISVPPGTVVSTNNYEFKFYLPISQVTLSDDKTSIEVPEWLFRDRSHLKSFVFDD